MVSECAKLHWCGVYFCYVQMPKASFPLKLGVMAGTIHCAFGDLGVVCCGWIWIGLVC